MLWLISLLLVVPVFVSKSAVANTVAPTFWLFFLFGFSACAAVFAVFDIFHFGLRHRFMLLTVYRVILVVCCRAVKHQPGAGKAGVGATDDHDVFVLIRVDFIHSFLENIPL